MATHAARSEATRGALIRAGRELFGDRGYATAPLDEVVRRAGVTKGALYHHFEDKRALFLAVVEHVEQQLVTDVRTAAARSGDSPREQLRAGMREYVIACQDPIVQRIVLQDAPAVLGWEKWRSVDRCHFAALLEAGLAAAMSEQERATRPVTLLTQVVRGGLAEAAQMAYADPALLPTVLDVVDGLLEGLLPTPVPG